MTNSLHFKIKPLLISRKKIVSETYTTIHSILISRLPIIKQQSGNLVTIFNLPICLTLQFSNCDPETPGGLKDPFRGLQGQKYFHSSTKALHAFLTLILSQM